MANYNNNQSRSNQGYGQRSNPKPGYSDNKKPAPAPIVAEQLPADYVDLAERVIREIYNDRQKITTSKIRNLLSLITEVYNVENLRSEETILASSATQLTMMRIRIVYECGRDIAVKDFVEKAHLLQYLKGLGDKRENIIRMSHYMEALVAYHRYIIGGKEG